MDLVELPGDPEFRLELMLLAEALLLLALDEDRAPRTWVTAADQGLAGALLLDLAGREERPAEPPLARWDVVAAEERPAEALGLQLPGKSKPIKGTVAAGLVERGVLDEERVQGPRPVRAPRATRSLTPSPSRSCGRGCGACSSRAPSPPTSTRRCLVCWSRSTLSSASSRERAQDRKARAKEIAERGRSATPCAPPSRSR